MITSCPALNSKKLGEVKRYSWDQDFAFAKETSDAAISGLDNEIISASYTVQGHVTENGIDSMISNSEDGEKYGNATCHTKGTVKEKIDFTPCSNGTAVPYIKTGANASTGDSGCPHYRDLNNYGLTTVIGIHWGSGTDAIVSAAYAINNSGITFTSSNSC